jgi:hypothetical protein
LAKIAEAVRPSIAQRIAAEERAIDEATRDIDGMRTALAAKLLTDDDPTEADKLADAIAKADRRLGIRQDRLAALQGSKKREAADDRHRQKDISLGIFEQTLSNRVAAAALVDKAAAEFAASLIAYRAACRVPFEKWPATFPPIKLFEGASQGYIASRIAAALHMRASGSTAHTLLTELPARLGKQEEADIKLAASMVEDIRKSPLPKQFDDGIAA